MKLATCLDRSSTTSAAALPQRVLSCLVCLAFTSLKALQERQRFLIGRIQGLPEFFRFSSLQIRKVGCKDLLVRVA